MLGFMRRNRIPLQEMREWIGISEGQKEILLKMAECGEIPVSTVWRSITYREVLLEAFESLVQKHGHSCGEFLRQSVAQVPEKRCDPLRVHSVRAEGFREIPVAIV
jgi:hypothetical protein